ncbi:tRNA (adenine-N1)-methyltransferase [Candidatus Binatia bacterium]|nr:tRNA (adenine-N1)-methyltransferase [Candidatus Binatia bacterium]
MDVADQSLLRAGDAVVLIDRKEREYLRVLRPGTRIHLRSGNIETDALIGEPEGRVIYNSGREAFLVLRPTFAQLIPNLPRQAQVIYPKDIGPILLWGDIYPGATVIEVGAGPGALTMALLRAVGTGGRVVTYEIREDFVDMARGNVRRFLGETPNWTVKHADARLGFEESGVDRLTCDMPEPWTVLAPAAEALRPGGAIVGYVPTVLQVKHFVDALRSHGAFAGVQVFEAMQRFWHVQGQSVRPDHRMVAHTGFVIVARRVVERGFALTHDAPCSSDEISPDFDPHDER